MAGRQFNKGETDIYLTDRIAFLQLQKTGCSHVTRVLEMVAPGRQLEMHDRCSKEVIDSGRLIAGSVRDPWDWYVSLWGYGCDGKGVLHSKLTEKKKLRGHGIRNNFLAGLRLLFHDMLRKRGLWTSFYSDVHSPENFRLWLRTLHTDAGARATKGDYARSSISSFAGLYTFRFCRLFLDEENLLYSGAITSPSELRRVNHSRNILQHVVRMENITEGILDMLRISRTTIGKETEAQIRNMERTNPSSRRKDLSFYYDEETVELVQKMDFLIVEEFGYSRPETS